MKLRTETFLRSDIENALKAVGVTGLAFAKELNIEDHTAFTRGFAVALTAIAIAFDIDGYDGPAVHMDDAP